MGGAFRARTQASPDGVRIRQAVACLLPTGPDTGRARDGWHRPARAGPCVGDAGTPGLRRLNATPAPHPQDGPPQARFHLRPGCRPALARTRGRGLSGGWLGRPSPLRHDPAASGTRRCTASSVVVPHVPAPPGGLPPAWTGTFADPSVSGSASSVAQVRNVGMKKGIFLRTPGISLFPTAAPRIRSVTAARCNPLEAITEWIHGRGRRGTTARLCARKEGRPASPHS